jgi:hypothetical protein
MAGLVPAIHVFANTDKVKSKTWMPATSADMTSQTIRAVTCGKNKKDVDARHKAGHDESNNVGIAMICAGRLASVGQKPPGANAARGTAASLSIRWISWCFASTHSRASGNP